MRRTEPVAIVTVKTVGDLHDVQGAWMPGIGVEIAANVVLPERSIEPGTLRILERRAALPTGDGLYLLTHFGEPHPEYASEGALGRLADGKWVTVDEETPINEADIACARQLILVEDSTARVRRAISVVLSEAQVIANSWGEHAGTAIQTLDTIEAKGLRRADTGEL